MLRYVGVREFFTSDYMTLHCTVIQLPTVSKTAKPLCTVQATVDTTIAVREETIEIKGETKSKAFPKKLR